jgi:hypothetical protein
MSPRHPIGLTIFGSRSMATMAPTASLMIERTLRAGNSGSVPIAIGYRSQESFLADCF